MLSKAYSFCGKRRQVRMIRIACLLISILALSACSHQEYTTSGFVGERVPASAISAIKNMSYWPYELEGCMNTKDQFLQISSLRKPGYTKERKARCNIKSGKWIDFFTHEEVNNAEEVLVTPVIPLKHALSSGADKWSLSKLHAFLHDREIMILFKKNEQELSYQANEKGLLKLPEKEPSRCEMLGMWAFAKDKWGLQISEAEKVLFAKESPNCVAQGVYSREFFRHWFRRAGFTCDSRVEALRRDSTETIGHISTDRACMAVTTGKWKDPYTNRSYNQANEHRLPGMDADKAPLSLDVDHVVPLKHTYLSGGWQWPQWKKEQYANYMRDRNHLLSVDASENRAKGAKHPGNYMPPNTKFHCRYLEIWLGVKLRWGLRIFPEEHAFIADKLATKCTDSVDKGYGNILQILLNPELRAE